MREPSSGDPTASETTLDGFLDGRIVLEQPRRGHRVGTDAMLLAAAAGFGLDHIADYGAGVGAVGIAAGALRPGTRVTLLEREAELCHFARLNIIRNGLEEVANILEVDVLRPAAERQRAGLALRSFDQVLTNPPFAPQGTGRVSPDAMRRKAHVLDDGSLVDWIKSAVAHLKPRGSLVMIHRADALNDILPAMRKSLGDIRLVFIYPDASKPASRLLAKGTLGSRAPLSVLSPIILHDRVSGGFTMAADALHRGRAAIDWINGGLIETEAAIKTA